MCSTILCCFLRSFTRRSGFYPPYVTEEPLFTQYTKQKESEWILADNVNDAWDKLQNKSQYQGADRLYVEDVTGTCYHYFYVDKTYFPNPMSGTIQIPYDSGSLSIDLPTSHDKWKVWLFQSRTVFSGSGIVEHNNCTASGNNYSSIVCAIPYDSRGNLDLDNSELVAYDWDDPPYDYTVATKGGNGLHGPGICNDGCTDFKINTGSYVPIPLYDITHHEISMYRFSNYKSNGQFSIQFEKNHPTGVEVMGTMLNVPLAIGQAQELPKLAFECPGYVFNGWCTTPDGSGDLYMDEQIVRNLSTTGNSTVKLYAQWKEIEVIPDNARYTIYNYTGGMQYFTAPFNCIYKVEAWGAQGGNFAGYRGGRGAYAYTYVRLKEGQKLNIAVGGQNATFNGGGRGYVSGGNGGGATSVTIGSDRGELMYYDQCREQILLVAGGGGGAARDDVSGDKDAAGMYNSSHAGGDAGLNGSDGHGEDPGLGATQTAAGSEGGFFGCGGNGAHPNDAEATAGGGGGFYGGGGAGHPNSNGGGGGGSSYIATSLANGYDITVTEPGSVTGGANSGHGKVHITPHACIVHYDPNPVALTESVITGTMDEQFMPPDEYAAIKDNEFGLKGYKFKYWCTTPDGTGDIYRPGQQVMNITSVGTVINLFAIWEPINYYVIYDSNNGTGKTYTTGAKHQYDKEYDPVAASVTGFKKTGYYIKYWYYKPFQTRYTAFDKDWPAGTNRILPVYKNLTHIDEATVTLHAKWEPIKYTIRVHENFAKTSDRTKDFVVKYDQDFKLPYPALWNNRGVVVGYDLNPDVKISPRWANQDYIRNLTDQREAIVDIYTIWDLPPKVTTSVSEVHMSRLKCAASLLNQENGTVSKSDLEAELMAYATATDYEWQERYGGTVLPGKNKGYTFGISSFEPASIVDESTNEEALVYYITFTCTDDEGQSAQASITLFVGDIDVDILTR